MYRAVGHPHFPLDSLLGPPAAAVSPRPPIPLLDRTTPSAAAPGERWGEADGLLGSWQWTYDPQGNPIITRDPAR